MALARTSNRITTTATSTSCAVTANSPKQRILFLLAGAFSLIGGLLALTSTMWFALIPAVVGANQLFMAGMGWCPMSKLLDRLLPETAL